MDNGVTAIRPFELTVETGGDQFPVSSARPELSWKLPSNMDRQRSFELEATIGEERLSHRADGSRHRFVSWPWRDLHSAEQVSWRVRVQDEQSLGEWSFESRFEAGLFEDDWSSEWIASPEGGDRAVGERPAYEFTGSFVLSGEPEPGARLYLSALGVYDAFVNDIRAGSGELLPGSQSYDRTLYAQALDVSSALRAGENIVRVILSDGWFRGRAGAFRHQAAWGTHTALRAELHVVSESGAKAVILRTGQNWVVAEANIVQADLMDGQTTDLTRSVRPIGNAIASPAEVPAISWSPAPPVRVAAELAPLSVSRRSDSRVVVDFGQNASGRVKLSSLGTTGARTVLTFGEHITPAGELTLTHLDTPGHDGTNVPFVQQDAVVSDGDDGSTFEPHHTLHGFQYVQIDRDDLDLEASEITMQVLHSDLKPVGEFSCSNDDLNRLWAVATWSFLGNAVDVPTDCPTRERAGWTGDWQIFLPTAVRLFDVDGFSRKWLKSVRDDQLDDGRIVNISPDATRLRTTPGIDFATGSAGWGDAIVLVPWELYRNYGDTRVLEDSWDAMVRWVNFALRAAAENRHPSRVERSAEPLPHEQYLWDATFHFGEWCEPTPLAEDGTPGPTIPDPAAWAASDKGEVGTAYLYRSVSTLALVAKTLGRSSDASRYAEFADRIRDAWRFEYIDADGRTPNDTQASYVRALAFDLAPEPVRALAAQHLVDRIAEADWHLGTGFLSTADLLPVLADAGHADVAQRLLMQRTTPSWLGMLDRGATTIWEEWEGIDRNGNAHASLNHYSKGAVIRYLHSHILGLRLAENAVAWESFVVNPIVPDGISWARGSFDSPQGLITVEWEASDGDRVLRVHVPGGATATVIWGGQTVTVQPGTHEFPEPATAGVEA